MTSKLSREIVAKSEMTEAERGFLILVFTFPLDEALYQKAFNRDSEYFHKTTTVAYTESHDALRVVELRLKEVETKYHWNKYLMENLWGYTDRYIEATPQQKFLALSDTIAEIVRQEVQEKTDDN